MDEDMKEKSIYYFHLNNWPHKLLNKRDYVLMIMMRISIHKTIIELLTMPAADSINGFIVNTIPFTVYHFKSIFII